MTLTEEQKERMRKNRERALEIQRKRREEATFKSANAADNKRSLKEGDQGVITKRSKKQESEGKGKAEDGEDYDDDLEAFEEGASDLVPKTEAKKMYCLPEGSLAVCKVRSGARALQKDMLL